MQKSFLHLIILICVIYISPLKAENPAPGEWTIGTELDFNPIIFNGYYISAFAGYKNLQLRFVRTNISSANFETETGIKNNNLDINAFFIDYYFKNGFTGWWIGTGLEKGQGKITKNSSTLEKCYHANNITLSGGYTFRINNHFYLNPWVGLQIPIGEKNVQFENETFKSFILPEGSVKLGFNF